MDFLMGIFVGMLLIIISIVIYDIDANDKCRKENNVYECEKNVEWTPIDASELDN